MTWDEESQSWYGAGEPLARSVAIRSARMTRDGARLYWFELSHWETGRDNRKSPQSAANDAERWLKRLKTQIERMMSDGE
jgi:predicted alpha/beta-hydrolase family hydrolase